MAKAKTKTKTAKKVDKVQKKPKAKSIKLEEKPKDTPPVTAKKASTKIQDIKNEESKKTLEKPQKKTELSILAHGPKASKTEEKPSKGVAAKKGSSEDEARWQELYEKHKSEKVQTYNMRGTFEAQRPLNHKILGWGWILSNENDRLEVLFKEGKKILISNYSS